MNILSNRGLKVAIGAQNSVGVLIEGPHMSAKIKRSLEGKDLDEAEVTIYNPNKQCVDLVMSTKTQVFSEVKAWYYSTHPEGTHMTTFRGVVDAPMSHQKKDLDYELKYSIVDGLQELTKKPYQKSMDAKTLWITILEDIINQAVGVGAAAKYISAGVRKKLGMTFNDTTWVKSCSFSKVLDDFCKIHELKWTMQNGVPRVVLKRDTSQLKFFDLNSGVLIENIAPSKVEKDEDIVYKCKSFYLADVLPGDYITLFGGKYIILSLEHNLTNFSGDFSTSLVLEELG